MLFLRAAYSNTRGKKDSTTSPRELRITGEWNLGGPFLPVEFARASQEERLTLVLYPGTDPALGNVGLISMFKFGRSSRRLGNPSRHIKEKNRLLFAIQPAFTGLMPHLKLWEASKVGQSPEALMQRRSGLIS